MMTMTAHKNMAPPAMSSRWLDNPGVHRQSMPDRPQQDATLQHYSARGRRSTLVETPVTPIAWTEKTGDLKNPRLPTFS